MSHNNLTYTSSSWDTTQAVTVSGVHDDNADHETVTVSLNATSTDAEYVSKTGSVTVTLADNTATGDPIITGVAQVGWTLTADTSDVMDPDGLNNVVYIYQWIRVDSDGTSNPTNVGSNSTTYTLAPADEGKKLKVQVSFTDDLGNSEQRPSAVYPSGTGTVTPVDPDTLPELSFRESGQVISEGTTTPYQVVVDIDPVRAEAFDITLEISGTAESGVDYAVATTQTVSANLATLEIPIQSIDDNVFEGQEKAIFRITVNPTQATVGPAGDTFELSIEDNDAPPTLSVTAQAGAEGGQNQGPEPVQGQDFANVVFKLELAGEFTPDISMDIEAIDVTAVRGQDYQMDTTSVTFTNPPTVQYIMAPVIDDADFDGASSETFTLRVHNPSHQIIPGNTLEVTGVILDNEEAPEGVDYVGGDIHTTATIAVGQSWINGNPLDGSIEHLYDEDWYRTELRKGHCYQIDLSGTTVSEPGFSEDLTLVDPYLIGVYRDDGVFLPGTPNDNGRNDGRNPRHTLSFNKTGTYYIAATHSRWLDGGTFEISLYDMGTGNQTCTNVNVDDLTYEPGIFSPEGIVIVEPAIEVSFGASSYTATEGGTNATVTVTLASAPSAAVRIPITLVSRRRGATAADHSTIPASVLFTTSDTSKTFTVTARDDAHDDEDEAVRLGFGFMPSGYEASGITTTTVNLVDDDFSAADILSNILRESNLGCRVWAIEKDGVTSYKTEVALGETIFFGDRNTSGTIERVLCVPNEVLYVDECIPGIDAIRGTSLRRFYTIQVEEDRTVVYAFVETPYHGSSNPDPYFWRGDQISVDAISGSQALMAPYFIVKSAEQNSDGGGNPGPISIEIRHALNADKSDTAPTTLQYDTVTSAITLNEASGGVRIETGDQDFLVALTQRVLAILSDTFTPTITEDTNATYSITQVIGEGDFPVNPIDYCGDTTEDDF